MSIQDTMNKLKAKGIPVAYIRFKEPQKPPFVIYRGNGQTVLPADNVYFYSVNDYQIDYATNALKRIDAKIQSERKGD